MINANENFNSLNRTFNLLAMSKSSKCNFNFLHLKTCDEVLDLCKKTFREIDCANANYQQLLNSLKNLSELAQSYIKESKDDFGKIDAFLLLTCISYQIFSNSQNFQILSKILFQYALLYFNNKKYLQCCFVIIQYWKHCRNASCKTLKAKGKSDDTDRESLFQSAVEYFNQFQETSQIEINAALEHVDTIMAYNFHGNLNVNVNLNFNADVHVNFLILFLNSTIEINLTPRVFSFIQTNWQLLLQFIQSPKQFGNFLKILLQMNEKVFQKEKKIQLDKTSDIARISLSCNIKALLYDVLFDSSQKITEIHTILDFVSTHVSELCLAQANWLDKTIPKNKKEILEFCDQSSINWLYLTICHHIENYFESRLSSDEITIRKKYCNILGKIYNFYNNFENATQSSIYVQKLFQQFKAYKIVTVEMLLIKVNLFRDYLQNNKYTEVNAMCPMIIESADELCVIVESIELENASEKHNFKLIQEFLKKCIETMLKLKIYKLDNEDSYQDILRIVQSLENYFTAINVRFSAVFNCSSFLSFCKIARASAIQQDDDKEFAKTLTMKSLIQCDNNSFTEESCKYISLIVTLLYKRKLYSKLKLVLLAAKINIELLLHVFIKIISHIDESFPKIKNDNDTLPTIELVFPLFQFVIEQCEARLNYATYEKIIGKIEGKCLPRLQSLFSKLFAAQLDTVIACISASGVASFNEDEVCAKVNQTLSVFLNYFSKIYASWIKIFSLISVSFSTEYLNLILAIVFEIFSKFSYKLISDTRMIKFLLSWNPSVVLKSIFPERSHIILFINDVLYNLINFCTEKNQFTVQYSPDMPSLQFLHYAFNSNPHRKNMKEQIPETKGYWIFNYIDHIKSSYQSFLECKCNAYTFQFQSLPPIKGKADFLSTLHAINEIENKMNLFGIEQQSDVEYHQSIVRQCVDYLSTTEDIPLAIILKAKILPSIITENSVNALITKLEAAAKKMDEYREDLQEATCYIRTSVDLLLAKDNSLYVKSVPHIEEQLEKIFVRIERKQENNPLNSLEYFMFIDILYWKFVKLFNEFNINEASDISDFNFVKQVIRTGSLFLDKAISSWKVFINNNDTGKFYFISNFYSFVTKSKLFLLESLHCKKTLLNSSAVYFQLDYTTSMLNLLRKIKAASLILTRFYYSFGLGEESAHLISNLSKIHLIVYDKSYTEEMMKMSIKAMSKFYKKIAIDYNPHNDLKSLYQYAKVMQKITSLYLTVKCGLNDLEMFEYFDNSLLYVQNIPRLKEIWIEYLSRVNALLLGEIWDYDLYKFLNGFSHYLRISDQAMPGEFRSQKERRLYLKSLLWQSAPREWIISEYTRLFSVLSDDVISNHWADLEYKDNLIVYFKLFSADIIENSDYNITMIISQTSLGMHHNLNLSYARLKFAKKNCCELINTLLSPGLHRYESNLQQILSFYIENLLNYKSLLFTKMKISNSPEREINYYSFFKIKDKILFAIKYQNEFAYQSFIIETLAPQCDNSNIQAADADVDIHNILESLKKEIFISENMTEKVPHRDKCLEMNLFLLQRKLFARNSACLELLTRIYTGNSKFMGFVSKNFKEKINIKKFIESLVHCHTDANHNENQSKSKYKSYLKNQDEEVLLNHMATKFYQKNNTASEDIIDFYDESNVMYFIPSNELSNLPFENIPILFKLPILRIVHYRLGSLDRSCIDISHNEAFYLLNPAGDLKTTEKCLSPFFEKLQFKGIVGSEPRPSEMEQALCNKKMFIYSGHGDATRYTGLEYLKNNPLRFITFLMGCSSAKIENPVGRDSQPFGVVSYYQMNECPFFAGYLWTVTSRDVDNFLIAVLERLFIKKTTNSLLEAVLLAKHTAEGRYLNSAPLVVYARDDLRVRIIPSN